MKKETVKQKIINQNCHSSKQITSYEVKYKTGTKHKAKERTGIKHQVKLRVDFQIY